MTTCGKLHRIWRQIHGQQNGAGAFLQNRCAKSGFEVKLRSITMNNKRSRRRFAVRITDQWTERPGKGLNEMPSLTADEKRAIGNLIASRRAGYSLPGEFYSSELVYRAELDRIWRRGWLFAGHSCEIANPGDYFTLSVGADSLIIIRDDACEV